MNDNMKFTRAWAMPNADTFSIRPIGEFVGRYLGHARVSVDPFARNCSFAANTNDLNPATSAQHHMDAEEYLRTVAPSCDLILFDPPYSPRQISECYKQVGREVGMAGTQNGALYKRVRDAADSILQPGGIILSFGWNSNGMGKTRGYEMLEILLVAHGGGHNDTICLAERKPCSP
jgi:methylase of polypeptide subunit release factors